MLELNSIETKSHSDKYYVSYIPITHIISMFLLAYFFPSSLFLSLSPPFLYILPISFSLALSLFLPLPLFIRLPSLFYFLSLSPRSLLLPSIFFLSLSFSLSLSLSVLPSVFLFSLSFPPSFCLYFYFSFFLLFLLSFFPSISLFRILLSLYLHALVLSFCVSVSLSLHKNASSNSIRGTRGETVPIGFSHRSVRFDISMEYEFIHKQRIREK
jgi:hypothetical protein